MQSIKIGLADDHHLFRNGVKNALEADPHLEVKLEAADGEELLQKMTRQRVDVVVTDINMKPMDGIQMTKIIKRDFKGVKVVGLSMYGFSFHIRKMLDAGAEGYMMKSASPDELVCSVKQVLGGKMFFCKETSEVLLSELVKTKGRHPILTERDFQVLDLIFQEKSEEFIARELETSQKTIHRTIVELMDKLGVETKVGLVKWIIEKGLV